MRARLVLLLLLLLCGAARADVTAVAFSPDGRLFAAHDNGDIEAWQLQPDTMVHRWGSGQKRVRAFFFSSDGRWIATTGDNGTVKIWDAKSYHARVTIRDAAGPVGIYNDNNVLTTRPGSRGVYVWRLDRNYGAVRLATILPTQAVYGISADGSRIATKKGEWEIRVWAVNASLTTRQIQLLKSPGWGGIINAFISRDGRYVVALGSTVAKPPDAFAKVFDTQSGAASGYYAVGTNVNAAAVSPDSSTIAVLGSFEGTPALLAADLNTRKTLWAHNFSTSLPDFGNVSLIAVSDRYLATAGGKEIRLWDVRTCKPLSRLAR